MTLVDQAAAIRSGEELDVAALAPYLTDQLGGDSGETLTVLQFPSGYSNLTYMLQLGGRKLVLRNLDRPVYLYALRFVPSKRPHAQAGGEPVTRWLATDHVTIAKDPDRHFAFPGVALLKNGELVYMLERHQIEGRSPHEIAEDLNAAFGEHCS